MSEMTPDRLRELRRIAEAATPGSWWVDGWEVRTKDGDHFIASIAPAFQGDRPDASCWELDANIRHIAAFDPPTVLALLDEIERLRRERDEDDDKWTRYEELYVQARGQIVDLQLEIERLRREREEIVDNVTRFALYDPDLNAWECQACRFWWEFEDGDPYEHDMRFCPRCGRRIVAEVRDVEDGEAEDGENDA